MPEVKVQARISEEHLRAYEAEAIRRGVPVAKLVEQTVNVLLAELERAEEACRETGSTS